MSDTSIAVQQSSLVTEDDIKKFIFGSKTLSQVPKAQVDVAIGILKAFNLNPFKREAHLIPYSGEIKIIVGYEVYLKRAEATKKLNGWKVEIEGEGQNMKAVLTVYRKDWEYPFVHEVYASEVAQNTPTWQKMRRFMLKKVAIGQGFRLAFPEDIGGMPYTEDEMSELTSHSSPASYTPPEEPKDEDVSEQPQDPVEDVTPTCEVCGKTLTQKAADFSMGKYGRYQCITHSKNAPSQTAEAVEPEVIDENTPATEEQKEKLHQFIRDGKLDAKYEDKIEKARYLASKRLIEQLEAQG